MSFTSRLKQLVDEISGGNAAEFARQCDVQDSSIRQYLKGTKPSLENLVAICAATGVSLDWLAAGRGRKNSSDSQEDHSADAVAVLRLHLVASAGFGSTGPSEPDVDTVAIPKSLLEQLGIKASEARVIQATGISMLPTIGDGDLMIANVAKDQRTPIDGRIYVFSIDDSLFVKRLQRSSSGWMMVSDNRPLYPPEPIDTQRTVTIHGQIVWVGRKLS